MRRAIRGLAACVALIPALACAQPSVTFDGERYMQRFENRAGPVRVVEYVRPSETLDTWTQLVAIRHFRDLGEPRTAAQSLAGVVRQHNPEARSQVIVKDDGSEAIVDFLTWAPGDDRMEFNIHRYRRVAGMPGLIAYQFAWRFRSAELADATATVRANRQRWLDAMRRTELPNPFTR